MKTAKTFYSKSTLCHIVNEFQDRGEAIVTFRFWSRKKRTWIYKTIPRREYDTSIELKIYRIDKDPIYKKQKLF